MSRITTPITWSYANKSYILKDAAIKDLIITGTYIPTVKKLLFNVGKKTIKSHIDEKIGKKFIDEEKAVLTTIVHWTDGTKTVVTNSDHDPIEFEKDGTTPSRASRERGFVYAFFKRCISKYAFENGETVLKAEGLGRILSNLIDSAYDCNAKHDAAKSAKAKPEQMELPLKTKKKHRPSLAQCAVDLSDSIKDLKAAIAEMKSNVKPAEDTAEDAVEDPDCPEGLDSETAEA